MEIHLIILEETVSEVPSDVVAAPILEAPGKEDYGSYLDKCAKISCDCFADALYEFYLKRSFQYDESNYPMMGFKSNPGSPLNANGFEHEL